MALHIPQDLGKYSIIIHTSCLLSPNVTIAGCCHLLYAIYGGQNVCYGNCKCFTIQFPKYGIYSVTRYNRGAYLSCDSFKVITGCRTRSPTDLQHLCWKAIAQLVPPQTTYPGLHTEFVNTYYPRISISSVPLKIGNFLVKLATH